MRLTPEEAAFIKNNEDAIDNVMRVINAVKLFKEGDFLIAFHQSTGYGDTRVRPVVNSYGALKKFQVVHVDKHGIPYMKELNKNGKPAGQLVSSVKHDNHRGVGYNYELTYIFEVDPDYADSIILDDQANYNATEALKTKSDAFKAIAEHNKAAKVYYQDKDQLVKFLITVKVGDIIWRSHTSHWNVIEVNPIPKDVRGRMDGYAPFIKIIDHKGKQHNLCIYDFSGKALYTSRPRTYKELKDPK